MIRADLSVDLISPDRSHCITDDGKRCDFTNFFDAFGDEIEEPSEAVTAVAFHRGLNIWIAVDFTQFEQRKLN